MQERAVRQPGHGVGRASCAGEPGARGQDLDPPGVRLPGRGGVLGSQLRRSLRAAHCLLPWRRPRPGDGRRLAPAPLPRRRHGEGAKVLMEDNLLHPDFPHYVPRTVRGDRPEPDDVLGSPQPRRCRLPPRPVVLESSRRHPATRSCGRGAARRTGKADGSRPAGRTTGTSRRPTSLRLPEISTCAAGPGVGCRVRPRPVVAPPSWHGGAGRARRCPGGSPGRGGLVRPLRGRGVRPGGRAHPHLRRRRDARAQQHLSTFVAPTCRTSWSSSRPSPTSPRSCWSRTTGRRRRSSTPPTR